MSEKSKILHIGRTKFSALTGYYRVLPCTSFNTGYDLALDIIPVSYLDVIPYTLLPLHDPENQLLFSKQT